MDNESLYRALEALPNEGETGPLTLQMPDGSVAFPAARLYQRLVVPGTAPVTRQPKKRGKKAKPVGRHFLIVEVLSDEDDVFATFF